jgi:hypothetical protein
MDYQEEYHERIHNLIACFDLSYSQATTVYASIAPSDCFNGTTVEESKKGLIDKTIRKLYSDGALGNFCLWIV